MVASAMPMSATATRAAMRAPGQQQVAGLAPREGHGPGRPDRGAAHLRPCRRRCRRGCRRRGSAGPAALMRSTARARRAVEVARQARAEQGVDDQIGFIGPDEPQTVADRAASSRAAARAASPPGARARIPEAARDDGMAALGQETRGARSRRRRCCRGRTATRTRRPGPGHGPGRVRRRPRRRAPSAHSRASRPRSCARRPRASPRWSEADGSFVTQAGSMATRGGCRTAGAASARFLCNICSSS